MLRAIKGESLGLRAKNVNAHGTVSTRENSLPFLDPTEHDSNKFRAPELSPARIDPDDGLVQIRAKQNHVVVRRHDNLIGRPGVSEDDIIS